MRISPGLRSIRQVRRASILAVCLQLLIHIGCKQNSPPTTPDAPAHESGWINASIEGVEQSFLEYQMLSAVSFSAANHGTAVGSNGISLHTTDGGKRWTLQPTGTWYDLAGVCQIDSTTAYAVGAENAIYGIVLGTMNGGRTGSIYHSKACIDLVMYRSRAVILVMQSVISF